MKHSNFILGIALLVLAATLAITITFRNAPDPVAESPRTVLQNSKNPSRAFTPSASNHQLQAKTSERRQRVKAEDLEILIDLEQVDDQSTANLQALNESASKIQKEALQKLDRMTERFALTQDQRREILPLLIKSSKAFNPAMSISDPASGIPLIALNGTQTPDEEIHQALDPEQQAEFEEQAIDDNLWWSEIAANLAEDYDASIANLPIAATAPSEPENTGDTGSAPVEDNSQQGGNIFDLIESE